MMARQKILVCGATGFIGHNIVERLALRDDFDVHAVWHERPAYDLPGVTWHKADLRQADQVANLLCDTDIVIQAAAATSGSKDTLSQPHIHVTDNALMNSVLLRAAFDFKISHFIFFSCTVMYPSSDEPLQEDEWDANQEMLPVYFGIAWTKVYVEKMCEFFAGRGATKHTAIRHSNIYGAYDKFDLERSHVFGATMTKCLSAKDGKVNVWGSGEESRDLLHVDDLVDFVEAAMENQKTPFEIYNAGAGVAVTVKDLVAKIIAASGKPLTIEHDLSKLTIKTGLCLDCSKAKKQLGWSPKTSLDEGIVKTMKWWRSVYDKS